MPFPGAEIVRRQKNLRGVKPELFALRLVHRHQTDLTDCRQRLHFRQLARSLFQSEGPHSGSDRSRRDQQNLNPRIPDNFDLTDQNGQRLRIRQQTGPRLDDNAFAGVYQSFSNLDIVFHDRYDPDGLIHAMPPPCARASDTLSGSFRFPFDQFRNSGLHRFARNDAAFHIVARRQVKHQIQHQRFDD